MAQKEKVSYGQWWKQLKLSKTMVFWIGIGAVILTIVVGFYWGGWVTGNTSQRTADVSARDAVVERLAFICVAQFDLDPQKEQKLLELKEASRYQQDNYVRDQGWATMPGDEKADDKVATLCAELLVTRDEVP
jgi:hypothetical protein